MILAIALGVPLLLDVFAETFGACCSLKGFLSALVMMYAISLPSAAVLLLISRLHHRADNLLSYKKKE